MLKRIRNLFVGFITLGIVKLEESNPEVLIENLKVEIDKKIKNTREQIIKAKVNYKVVEKQVAEAKKQLETTQKYIQKAIEAKDENLLVQLYLQEKENQKTYEMINKLFEDIKVKFEKAESEYKIFKAEMESKKISVDAFKTQSQINKMRKEMLGSIDMEISNFDYKQVEKVIDKQTFELEAVEELEEESVSTKIRRMNVNSDLEEARAKAKAAIMG